MPRTTTEEVGILRSQVSTLTVTVEQLQAALLKVTAQMPAPPTPAKPPEPPKWASNSAGLGMDYGGPPSPTEIVAHGGSEWIKRHAAGSWTDSSGYRRTAEGELLISDGNGGYMRPSRPIGPDRTRREESDIALMDHMLDEKE
jgi:hypothetical protein